MAATSPQLKAEQVAAFENIGSPRGPFTSQDGSVHVVGESWWKSGPSDLHFVRYAMRKLDRARYWWIIRPSWHYGLVVIRGDEGIFTVDFHRGAEIGDETHQDGSGDRGLASHVVPGALPVAPAREQSSLTDIRVRETTEAPTPPSDSPARGRCWPLLPASHSSGVPAAPRCQAARRCTP
jgi:hypothetical protein